MSEAACIVIIGVSAVGFTELKINKLGENWAAFSLLYCSLKHK